MNRLRQRGLYQSIWIGLLAAYLIISVSHFDAYAWNYDEGVLLQTAVLTSRGFPLYAETVFNKPPLIIWWLQLAFWLGGETVAVANVSMLLLTTVGLILLGILARQWWGRWADVAAIAIYLLIPESLVRSAVVMNDLPAMTFMLAALVCATQFRMRQTWRWVGLTAVCFAIGLGLHPLLLFMALPVGLVLIFSKSANIPPTNTKKNWQNIFKIGLIFTVGVLVVTGSWLLLVDRVGFWEWVVAFNNTPLGDVLQERATRNGRFLLEAHIAHWPLLIAALMGLLTLLRERKLHGWVGLTFIWYATTLIVLNRLQPMWEHYIFFAFYPLVLIAAGGVGVALQQWSATRGAGRRSQFVARLPLLWAVVAVGWGVAAVREWQEWQPQHKQAQMLAAATFPQQTFVISNSPFLLFTTGHLVPPTLTDTSNKRISTGLLTPTDVLFAQQEYDVSYLLFEDKHFRKLPMLYQWAENEASQFAAFDQIAMYEMVKRPSPITYPLDVAFQPGIQLRGYSLEPVQATESELTVVGTFYWEGVESIPNDYQIFVHLVNEHGDLVGQHDGPPAAGRLPTSIWSPGIFVPDTFQISLPNNLGESRYQLMVGMYSLPDVQRLPAFLKGERMENDVVPITAVLLP
ncbi:MAG: phospholipid carrier-dependent glycosyltransferase [Chloroflexi bacterium]|nr:MAG: phospholipid carrier-dependent glycosyltransferase [Chloroflexota bacterium]